jgi:hypothetical protein
MRAGAGQLRTCQVLVHCYLGPTGAWRARNGSHLAEPHGPWQAIIVREPAKHASVRPPVPWSYRSDLDGALTDPYGVAGYPHGSKPPLPNRQ